MSRDLQQLFRRNDETDIRDGLMSVLFTSAAQALPITLTPAIAAVGTLNDSNVDGTYDAPGAASGFVSISGGSPRTAMVIEFAAPAIPAGATLVGGSLYVDDTGGGNASDQLALTANPSFGILAPRLSPEFQTSSAVPLPGTLALLGVRLAGLGAARRFRCTQHATALIIRSHGRKTTP